MATSKKTSIALAAGAALTAGMAFSPLASADAFASTELSSGYMQLAEHHAEEGKCGEAKCGGEMKNDMKDAEAKCGGEMKDSKKDTEGKCGEAKCGGE